MVLTSIKVKVLGLLTFFSTRQEVFDMEDFEMNNQSRASQTRILVIGSSPPVMETVQGELGLLGYDVQGTTRASNATADFNAGQFDMIAIGGGIAEAVRAELKSVFRQQNPAVRVLDVSAYDAVQSIVAAAEGTTAREHDVNLDAYFDRIQYSGDGAPTVATLCELNQRHIDAIPFEAIDALLGRAIDISLPAVESKLVAEQRGGYCLEHNPLFQNVLQQLGFQVEGLSARVRWTAQPGSPATPRSHTALKVAIEGEPWLVDVGFGGSALPQPLRLNDMQLQSTPHEPYRVFPFGNTYRLQILQNDEWRTLYDVHDDPLAPADYEMMNWFTSQHPDSHFRRDLVVARTTPDRRYALRNGRLTVKSKDRVLEQSQLDAGGIARALENIFGLAVQPDWQPVLDRAAAVTAATPSCTSPR